MSEKLSKYWVIGVRGTEKGILMLTDKELERSKKRVIKALKGKKYKEIKSVV